MSDAGQKTVLVVDDDAMVLKTLAATLELLGYNVITASSKADALAKYAANPSAIDAIVTDCDMPQHNAGIELTLEIRKVNPDIPIVMITGLRSVERTAMFERAGGNSILAKPFSLDEIERLLDDLLAPKRGRTV